jgi:hypothetical protein
MPSSRATSTTLEYQPGDKTDLALLKKLKAAGMPVVAVFLSGRPLWTNPEINASDAFVAAWLPGSEGGGVADVLVGDKAGKPRNDFQGKLSFSWPKRADQEPLNRRRQGLRPAVRLWLRPQLRQAGQGGEAVGEIRASPRPRSMSIATSSRPHARALDDERRRGGVGENRRRRRAGKRAPGDLERAGDGT